MGEKLQKKIGPLPIWAWAIVVGGVIGGIIILSRRGGEQPAGAFVGDETAGLGPDPTQGVLPGGGLVGGGSAPTFAENLGTVTDTLAQLQAAGLWPSVATEGAPAPQIPGLIQLAPGARYYDPTTGDVVDGPEQAAAAQGGAGPAAKKPKSALARAKDAVASGKVGPVNRRRLKAAGYTDAQINYHAKRKTPLQQPGKPKGGAKPKPGKPKQKRQGATATHPNQHKTAAAPNHGKPTFKTRRGTNRRGERGTYHIYSNRTVFVRDRD